MFRNRVAARISQAGQEQTPILISSSVLGRRMKIGWRLRSPPCSSALAPIALDALHVEAVAEFEHVHLNATPPATTSRAVRRFWMSVRCAADLLNLRHRV